MNVQPYQYPETSTRGSGERPRSVSVGSLSGNDRLTVTQGTKSSDDVYQDSTDQNQTTYPLNKERSLSTGCRHQDQENTVSSLQHSLSAGGLPPSWKTSPRGVSFASPPSPTWKKQRSDVYPVPATEGTSFVQCPVHSPLLRHSSSQSGRSVNSSAHTNSLSLTTSTPQPHACCQRHAYHQICPDVSVVGQQHHHPISGGLDSIGGFSLNERELNSLHKHIPGLRKYDLKTATIRQHYYPEGGWGWMVCACAFVIHAFTTGIQLAYGALYIEILYRFGDVYLIEAGWLGVSSFAVSLFAAPLVVALCRRKSVRLTAVFGGLLMALSCLFTSFAQQMHQVFFSYGVLLGFGISLSRETANLMLGQYFKRRRESIEMVVQAGAGVGTALFSVFYKEAIGY